MSQRTIIITGATKGLGRAIALNFAVARYNVIGLYSRDESAAQSLKSEAAATGAPASLSLLKHDIQQENLDLWKAPEIQNADRLILINNACAPFSPKPFHTLTWNDFSDSLEVGLRGSWNCIRGVLGLMVRRQRGDIVNVLSRAVSDSAPKGFAAYVSAKHALRGLTLALASEYRERGVRAFTVSPGFMPTALTSGWDPRLAQAISESGPGTDPAVAAAKIRSLVEDPATPGRGEDYHV